MPVTIPTCPHCGAALVVSRFAATVVCSYCGATVRVDPSAVSAQRYRDAWNAWNSPSAAAGEQSVADTRWTIDRLLAHGEISDVYVVRRARWPPEVAVLKKLRQPDAAALLEREWSALQTLHGGAAAGTMNLALRVPYPIVRDGVGAVYRWAPGFRYTFEAIRAAHPGGIEPIAAIWVWRRLLEILSVMKRAGLAHGAVLPPHILIEQGEHGLRLVGFTCAGPPGSPLPLVNTKFESLYPPSALSERRVSVGADVAMSAGCVAYLLGGDRVPGPLADLLRGVAESSNEDPWSLRERVGALGRTLFGPPSFHPIVMD